MGRDGEEVVGERERERERDDDDDFMMFYHNYLTVCKSHY